MCSLNTMPGICFQREELPNQIERIYLDAPKESINIGQLNACLSFISETDLPNVLLCINQLYFQAQSDPFFEMSDEHKASLEALSKLLIKFWVAERN